MINTVSFELAKLLKEKRFDIPTKKYYEYALKSKKDKQDGYSGSFGWKKGELNLQSDYFQNNSKSDFTSEMWYMCSAPTISEVVMWLYEKHGIWIHVHQETKINGLELIGTGKFQGFIGRINHTSIFGKKIKGDIPDGPYRKPVDSPTEAYEAAIEYCLTELI